MNGIKRLFGNKAVVSLLGIILIVVILYFSYSSAVRSKTNPIAVCVATQTIQPRTEITSSMVKIIKVPSDAVSTDVVRNCNQVYSKYSNYNTLIPAGSMIYNQAIIDKEDLPDSAFIKIKDGEVAYNFPVTMSSTYGNSMYPGNQIDIYMKVVDESGQVKVGRLFRNIEIAAVKDSSGRNVFEVSDNSRTPAFIIFGLKCEYYNLLKKASYLTSYSVELFPVPSNIVLSGSDNEVSVTSVQLEEFIQSHTVANDESEFAECVVKSSSKKTDDELPIDDEEDDDELETTDDTEDDSTLGE